MTAFRTRATVGPDGKVTISVGCSEIGREVDVTIAPAAVQPPTLATTRDEWRGFVHDTAGTWEGDLLETEDRPAEQRDPL